MGIITLQQAAQWCGGRIDEKYKDISFLGANMDTRKLEKGQLFVALQGVRDGHDFIPAALEKGAAAVLCTHCDGDYPAIVVEDTRIALGMIARGERQRLGVKVVGITGSVGKSTTKEMTFAVLETTYRVSKTPVNHNNDIGMPMAILAMPEDTQVAVLEMGMNHFREIAYLTDIAKPDIGVIVNIGTMHIEHLGSREGILKAKLEIREGMDEDGKLVLNGDDALLWGQRDDLSNVTYFGLENENCQVLGSNVTLGEETAEFTASFGGESAKVCLPLTGIHNVSDALAAIGVGMHMGVTPENICRALSCFRNMESRQEILETEKYTIIKDCYNAGPESMAASLTVLKSRKGRRIAVLGDMLELGNCSAAEHYKVGRLAAETADMLFAYGPNSGKMQKGAITGGMPHNKAFAYEDRSRLVSALKQQARSGDVLLFKGSRGMRMELALEQFLKEEE
ncbi:MAG: UDP-N-acetylmuramoyl-tripeptide--D-alanyl-D-alanine ligase [Oscillospiraceae bacterium]|nr:UDP-N-acetylmuramoyl-tripeptide--D-alanyl-D-alanine ligase [Oscillospiraceae bacterium]